MSTTNDTNDSSTDYDTTAERLAAEEDDLIFAITRETPEWSAGLRGFVTGIAVVALLGALHRAYQSATADDDA